MSTIILCGLCGRPSLGYATVTVDGETVRLCHDDGDAPMTCYHRWTVYGARPSALESIRGRWRGVYAVDGIGKVGRNELPPDIAALLDVAEAAQACVDHGGHVLTKPLIERLASALRKLPQDHSDG